MHFVHRDVGDMPAPDSNALPARGTRYDSFLFCDSARSRALDKVRTAFYSGQVMMEAGSVRSLDCLSSGFCFYWFWHEPGRTAP
jgi:hypothetical protein